MRWSQMHIPTLREDPADADAPSHRLLLRAGYIRQLMAGHYSLLPLAVRVRAKVIEIIRQEMNRIGAQEVLLPTMHPAEIWERSGRWEIMGEEMFRLTDRKGARRRAGHDPRGDLRGPGHRAELAQAAAAGLVPVPDQVPGRAAAPGRPAADPRVHHEGLLQLRPGRGRAGRVLRPAPRRLPAHLRAARHPGHPGRGVQRHHGRHGTRPSSCAPPTPARTWSRTARPATTRPTWRRPRPGWPTVADGPGLPAPERFDTPGVRDHRGPGHRLRRARRPADQDARLRAGRPAHAGADARRPRAERAEARSTPPARPRSARPSRTRSGRRSARCRAASARSGSPGCRSSPTRRCAAAGDMVTGANTDDVHLRGVDVDRDIAVGRWADLREVAAGEPARGAGSRWRSCQAIEVGHIFKLGYKYTEAFGVTVLGADGERGHADHGQLRHRRGARDGRHRRDATTTSAASSGRCRSRRSTSW